MNEYIIDESPIFTLKVNGVEYLATVRYYSNGDCDVEVGDGEAELNELVYDEAWREAERLGLIAEHGDGFDVPNYGDNV